MAYESQAVKLIKESVIPRLEHVEGEVQSVKGILISSGLDNGNGEAAATLHRIVADGIRISHRRSVGKLFISAYFGFIGRFFAVIPNKLMAVIGAASTLGWAVLAAVNIWKLFHH